MTTNLAKELKIYGFRNTKFIAKQIIQSINETTISYAKYKNMFRSILNNSTSFTWDMEKIQKAQHVQNSLPVYTIKNMPLKKQNPFFILSKRHRHGASFA